MNLDLSLSEKLQLIKILDIHNTGLIDLQNFLDKFDSRIMTEQGIKLILEKLLMALYYHNMSLRKAFEVFDINGDQEISMNEFIFGMT